MIWNVRGVILFIICLLIFLEKEKCDILVIIEYKFKESIYNYFDFIYNEYVCFVKFDDENIMYGNLVFIGKGGVVIMYKKFLMFFVKEVSCYNIRWIIGIKFDDYFGNIYYIIGVYLLVDSNIDVYM